MGFSQEDVSFSSFLLVTFWTLRDFVVVAPEDSRHWKVETNGQQGIKKPHVGRGSKGFQLEEQTLVTICLLEGKDLSLHPGKTLLVILAPPSGLDFHS